MISVVISDASIAKALEAIMLEELLEALVLQVLCCTSSALERSSHPLIGKPPASRPEMEI